MMAGKEGFSDKAVIVVKSGVFQTGPVPALLMNKPCYLNDMRNSCSIHHVLFVIAETKLSTTKAVGIINYTKGPIKYINDLLFSLNVNRCDITHCHAITE